MSLLVAFITLLFLVNSLTVMATRKASNISTTTLESHFSKNDTFTQDDGFRIAVGFDKSNPDFKEDYLELSAKILTINWISGEKNEIELELHTCTDEDFVEFYPVKASSERTF